MKLEIRNLTPHLVVIIHEDGRREIPASGQIARVSVSATPAGTFDGIPLRIPSFGEVVDLPSQEADTLLIVSALVRAACPDRADLASPADLVRDEAGRIVGCRALDVNNGGGK